MDIVHVPHNIKRSGQKAHTLLPHVHRVAALLKRWWLGTHQGSIEQQHLNAYLDEFVFRYNRRSSTYRGLLFHRLMEQVVKMPPTIYAHIIGGDEKMRREDLLSLLASWRAATVWHLGSSDMPLLTSRFGRRGSRLGPAP